MTLTGRGVAVFGILAFAAACAFAALTGGLHDPAAPDYWQHQTTQHIGPEEDEPGWNCATMGNRICGPVAP